MGEFYVYEWFDVDTDYVFYVGKGIGNRYKRMDSRNVFFTRYINKYRCDVRFINQGMTEEEAYALEIEMIKKYKGIGQCKCNIAEGGKGGVRLFGESNPMYGRAWYDENTTIEKIEEWKNNISQHNTGENNSMYGISPKERMDDTTYKIWCKTFSKNHKAGKDNNNYGNTKLSEFYSKNPEVAKIKQSRPGQNNGRCRRIYLYDIDKRFVEEFAFIGACAMYLIENNMTSSKIKSIRSSIAKSIEENRPYLNHYFSFCKL